MEKLEEYVVTFEGDTTDIMLAPDRFVGDLIAHALVAFGVHENAARCRLASFRRVFHPSQRLEEARVPAAVPLDLRLPL